MQSGWKNLFIVVSVLLLVALGFVFNLWNISEMLKGELVLTETQLVSTQNELTSTQDELVGTKLQLNDANAQLTDTKTKLVTTETKLTNTESQLTTTKTRLANAEGQLVSTKAQLSNTAAQLETAKNEQTRIFNQYNSVRKQIYVRFGTGLDCQTFITPNAAELSTKVQEITGGYVATDVVKFWRDYELMHRWVVNNIRYSYDSYLPIIPDISGGNLIWQEGFWRSPGETLQDKTGDCEDMAVLLASMMLNYNRGEYAVWAVTIRSTTPGVAGHVAVFIPVKGNNLAIFDPAGNYYTGYQSGYLRSDATSVAVTHWLNYWTTEIPGVYIDTIFSNTFYKKFADTAEFIKWMSER
ncbi:MAG: transglutaminase-like domain-containing protein [Dehalococcoidales bacterium]|nr:transglutaminase-like domain-containing protein [Dehalococcoidales bacterium]